MENQFLDLEKKYWKAMEEHDYATVKDLTRFPCVLASKRGANSIDEPTFKKMFESAAGMSMKINSFNNVVLQQVNESTVILAYTIEIEKEKIYECVCSSTWIKQNDRWICASHSEADLDKDSIN
ncbi:hypothetical protein Pedsa_0543 [Pseudopedobacter saltans DSM 12145]|uniref:DUF4440 domain-containing protein n=1 Tax=Pseudopedobacter saltans (strain ATCC 51119 / DSM 12145 / JCM 21818 / CCUG 39354 / LMG 10337 / NBRC 100064 / NCIMB 13643) TaxID=762903 RepID=F0S6P7_PSESL|nr:hypothetical protein [Pseudopedobacter saltans]ADY51123.1 hypothetical protein Pedsa_0543 [Pseudopedobacter saltans DSM 12145]